MQLSEKNAAPPKSGAKKAVLRLLRAALVAVPLAWIYSGTDAPALAEALRQVSVPLVAGITALAFANMALQGVKWWALIRRFVPDLGAAHAVSVHIESSFYSIVLPSAAAQDVVKSVMLSKTHNPSVVWAASWMARLLGFFSLLIFSLIGIILLDSGILPNGFRASMITAVAAIALLGALSFSKTLTRPLRSAAAKIVPKKLMAKIENLRDGVYAFKHARKTLAQTFALSTAIHFLIILNASLVVYAVSGKLYLVECLAFVPLVEIMVVSLPLTPGGLGVREALMALLFTQLGFSAEQIALYVTVNLFVILVTRVASGWPILYRMVFGGKSGPRSP